LKHIDIITNQYPSTFTPATCKSSGH